MWTPEARQRYAWTRKEGLRLTEPEWALLEPLLPRQVSLGRPWKHTLRTILDAILHLLRTGCPWERLARLGAAAQHGLRVVPPLSGRWLVGTVAPCPAHGRARAPG